MLDSNHSAFPCSLFQLLRRLDNNSKTSFLTNSDSTTSGTVESGHVPGDLGSVDGNMGRERAVLALFDDGGNGDLLLLSLGGRDDSNRLVFKKRKK